MKNDKFRIVIDYDVFLQRNIYTLEYSKDDIIEFNSKKDMIDYLISYHQSSVDTTLIPLHDSRG